MKAQTTQLPQAAARFSLSVPPNVQLVDLVCLLRRFGFRLHWNSQRRELETLPV